MMTLLNDRATRLTARVAPYRDAILLARKAGLTWADIGRVLGVQVPPAALRQAVRRCRYEAPQIPLPEPQAAPARPSATTQPVPQATPAAAQASTIKRLNI